MRAGALVFLFMACAPHRPPSPWAVVQRPIIMEIVPPAVFEVWWEQLDICTKGFPTTSHKETSIDWRPVIDYHLLRFVVVEDVPHDAGFQIWGMPSQLDGVWDYSPSTRTAYLGQSVAFNRSIVVHEMLHARGYLHDPVLFKRCGAVI